MGNFSSNPICMCAISSYDPAVLRERNERVKDQLGLLYSGNI